MVRSTSPLVMVALLAAVTWSVSGQVGNVAAGLSVDQCPMPTGAGFPGTYNPLTASAIQWCRVAERGRNSAVNNVITDGSRFWGTARGPDVSAGLGSATSPQTTGGQCTPAAAGLFPADGAGTGGAYAAATKACQQGNNYFPNQCRVGAWEAALGFGWHRRLSSPPAVTRCMLCNMAVDCV
jgi:hypothetical protein